MTGVCLLCGFVTPDLDVLDDHVDSHLREPDGSCPLCGAGVRQPCACVAPDGHYETAGAA